MPATLTPRWAPGLQRRLSEGAAGVQHSLTVPSPLTCRQLDLGSLDPQGTAPGSLQQLDTCWRSLADFLRAQCPGVCGRVPAVGEMPALPAF